MKKLLIHLLYQLKVFVRDPAYVFTSVLLPAGLYWFFAVPESKTDYIGSFLIVSFCAFSFVGISFFQHSVYTSMERDTLWYKYLLTLPCRSWHLLVSRFLISNIVAILSCLVIYFIGISQTDSQLSAKIFLKIVLLLSLFSIPFTLFGYFVGQFLNAKTALPVSNFFYLFFSFAGGLWKPPELLPKELQNIVNFWPTYHYGEIVWYYVKPNALLPKSSYMYLLLFSVLVLVAIFVKENLLKMRRRT